MGTTLNNIIICESSIAETEQNVLMILTTTRRSVFLDRQFGIDSVILYQPERLALTQLLTDIVEQIHKYEPRINVILLIMPMPLIMEP